MSNQDCSQEALDLAAHSKIEGFPDKHAMSTNRHLVGGIQGFLLILGLLVNLVICCVMRRRRKVKKSLSNFFLFNLSLTEIVLWLVVLPVAMVISMAQIETSIPCKILVFSIFTCCGVIFGLLAAIAFDRYTNIVNPLQGFVMEDRKITALAVIWSIAIITSAPFLYSATMRVVTMEFQSSNVYTGGRTASTLTVKMLIHGGDGSDTVKAIVRHETNVTHSTIPASLLRRSHATGLNSTLNSTSKCILPMRVCDIPANIKGQVSCIVFVAFSFVVPLVFISFAYTKIVQTLWLRFRANDAQGTAAKAKLRAVRMLFLVVLTFLLTEGPWTIGCLVYSFRARRLMSLQSHYTAVAIVTTLFYASAVLTPTIHAFHSSTVRKEIVNIVCCRFKDKTLFPSTTSSLVSTSRKYRAIHFAKNNEKLTEDPEALD